MNFEPEIRNGYTVTTDMKKIWAVQMDLLKALLEVCRRNNLRIWAEGGTLLGTVRHKGYIPWDDDIDMVMPREDYDRLLQIAPREFKHPLFLQHVFSENGYFRGHAQLRNSVTAAIRPGDIWQDFNQGIFIDIFVLDNTPETKEERKELGKILNHMRQDLYLSSYGSLLSAHPIRYISARTRISKAGGPVRYFQKMQRLVTDSDSSLVSLLLWNSDLVEKYTRKKAWYDKTVYLPFEDITMPVPAEYHKVLENQYGQYMTPVQAPTIHGSMFFDTGHSYREKIPEFRRKASLTDKLKFYFRLKP